MFKLMEGHVLPVDRYHGSFCGVADCWNLEGEEWSSASTGCSFVFSDLDDISCVLIKFDKIKITKELSIESTNHHNFIFGELAHASSLSSCYLWSIGQRSFSTCDLLPSICKIGDWKLNPFECWWILLICVLNAAKNINELVVEIRTGVVVSAFG